MLTSTLEVLQLSLLALYHSNRVVVLDDTLDHAERLPLAHALAAAVWQLRGGRAQVTCVRV